VGAGWGGRKEITGEPTTARPDKDGPASALEWALFLVLLHSACECNFMFKFLHKFMLFPLSFPLLST
jgi:hypothetical protein